MNDLEMIKAFAKLEGLHMKEYQGELYTTPSIESEGYRLFSPITDLALNCAARDKYEVNITRNTHYESQECFVNVSIEDGGEPLWVSEKEEIPRAVIKCILKSEGKL